MYYNVYMNLNNNTSFVKLKKHKNIKIGETNQFNHLLVGLYILLDNELISHKIAERRFQKWMEKTKKRKKKKE